MTVAPSVESKITILKVDVRIAATTMSTKQSENGSLVPEKSDWIHDSDENSTPALCVLY